MPPSYDNPPSVEDVERELQNMIDEGLVVEIVNDDGEIRYVWHEYLTETFH